MQPWQSKDLAKILAGQRGNLRLVNDEETIDTVADAIFAHPELGALATNARAAEFLTKALARLSSRYPRSSWYRQLDEWTPTLVTQVIDNYICDNCLGNLQPFESRRVAAAILLALQQMKPGDATKSTFAAPVHAEIPAADALVQYNLEWGDDDDDKTKNVSGEEFAITLTPAMTMVLYSVAGVPMTVQFVPVWTGEVEVASLHASELSSRMGFPKQLDESLENVRLLKLDQPLNSKAATDNISIPMVDAAGTIMINTDEHSFVDVIAPYTLVTCKYLHQPLISNANASPLNINLFQEMEKCGLLKDSVWPLGPILLQTSF